MEQGWSVGALAKVQTTWGEVIEGRVYSFDSALGLLYLQQQSERQQISFRVLKTSAIEQRLEPTPTDKNQLVDESSVRQREAEAIKKIEAKSRKIGKGVTAEAQKAFNAIENIYNQTEWKGSDIVVMKTVTVTAPYGPEQCSIEKPSGSHLLKVVQSILLEQKK